MKKKSMWLASLLAAFLLAAGTVQAQSVSDKISALEQELQQLKESQIELKKEATAAAAAMPSFSYRPGNGMMIEAADKSWSFRHSFEAHMRYNFESRVATRSAAAWASWKGGASGRSFICASITAYGRSTGAWTWTASPASRNCSAA